MFVHAVFLVELRPLGASVDRLGRSAGQGSEAASDWRITFKRITLLIHMLYR